MHRDRLDPTALDLRISELLVATADGSDPGIDRSVSEVLQRLREQLRMDVVFVSEFENGQRVFRFVDSAPDGPAINVGDSGPLESSFCQRVVDGRLAELVHDASVIAGLPPTDIKVGAHLSTPIRLDNGSVYGTLCCFSSAPNSQLQQRDLTQLRHCASLVGRRIDAALAQGERPVWALVPNAEHRLAR